MANAVVPDAAPGRRAATGSPRCEAAQTARPADTLDAAIAANKRDFDARFERAQRHFAGSDFTQAMDELLEIVMRDKAWKDGLARKTYVAILEIMTKPAPKADPAAPKQGALEVAGKLAATRRPTRCRRVPAQAEHGAVLTDASRRRQARQARSAQPSR